MCLVIVTVRSLLWTLTTLIATLAIFSAIVTPRWLIGRPTKLGLKSTRKPILELITETAFEEDTVILREENDIFVPTLGIYNRCTRIRGYSMDHCAPFIRGSGGSEVNDGFPEAWQASLVFFGGGLCLLGLSLIAALLSACIRSIRRKSLFTLAGTVQATSVLLFILALVLYPAGWGSERAQKICGASEPFNTGQCSLGWPFYVSIMGILLTCFSAILSIKADASTSTDKVQDRILEGRRIICLP